MLSISQNVCPCVCQYVCLLVCSLLRWCLNIFLPPLPEVGYPKIFYIQNYWGKIWKEVVSDLKTFTNKGFKIAAQKNLFWGSFCLYDQDFLVLVFLTPFNDLLPPLPKVQCANFLYFWNPWGKVMDRSGHRFENFCS